MLELSRRRKGGNKMKIKKCPLRTKSDDRNCIEDNCGWWEETFNGCSIRVLACAEALLASKIMTGMKKKGNDGD